MYSLGAIGALHSVVHWMILAGWITYMTWTSHREQIGSLNEFVTLLPSGKYKGLIIRMITVLIMSIKIISWIVQVQGKHLTLILTDSIFFILGGVRHETGQRSMIKVGLTSHPGIKRIKPRVYYTLPPTLTHSSAAVLILQMGVNWVRPPRPQHQISQI